MASSAKLGNREKKRNSKEVQVWIFLFKMHQRQKETLIGFRSQRGSLLPGSQSSGLFSKPSTLPTSCFLSSIYSVFCYDTPPLPCSCQHSNLQSPVEMPRSSVVLPRSPYLNMFPATTMSSTLGTLLPGLADPGFLSYSFSWTNKPAPSTPPPRGQCLACREPRGPSQGGSGECPLAKGKSGRNTVMHTLVR